MVPTRGDSDESPERVAAYIDGFNLYHGLMNKGLGRYRWLDFHALMSQFVRTGQELVEVKYFTSLMHHQPEKLVRQQAYLRALDAHGGITIIAGEFEGRRIKCRECDGWYKRPQEKKTDVNLATHLLMDAVDNTYDRALLITADSDLVPAVVAVRQRLRKRVTLLDPPRRHSDELAGLADNHLHINRSQLSRSQLPNPIEFANRRGKIQRIWRPDEWAPPT